MKKALCANRPLIAALVASMAMFAALQVYFYYVEGELKLVDALFITGMLNIMWTALLASYSWGAYSLVTFGIRKLIEVVYTRYNPSDSQLGNYHEYIKRERKKQHIREPLLIGAVSVAASFLLALI